MRIIRLATEADAKAIVAIYAPFVENTAISFETVPPTPSEMQKRITDTLGSLPWLVATSHERVLGYAYASQHRVRKAYQWSVDVSAYVATQAHRMGVGRALYTALMRVLVDLGYYNAFAGITLPNPASVGLHEAIGFKPTGVYRNTGHKFGAWHDVGWWQLELQPLRATPSPPHALGDIADTARFNETFAHACAFIKNNVSERR